MKKFIHFSFCLLIILYSGSGLIIAETVSVQTAFKTASGKIISLDKSQHYSVFSNGLVYPDESGTLLFYLFRLDPTGYMVVTANDHLPPVIAYSFMDDLSELNVDKNPLLSLITADIGLRLKNVEKLPSSVILERKAERNKLLQAAINEETDKTFQQWPPEGTTSTGGWLETNWTQSPPYNNFCPMDPITNQRSVAGCPATAMAQVLNYYKTINQTVFTDNDDYYHSYAGRNYWIDDDHTAIDFPSFPDLNAYLDTITLSFESNSLLKNNEKATLTFACGVAAHQVYTSQGSGTFGVNQAEQAYLRFGFTDALLLENNDTSLFTLLSKNMMEARPAHLAIVNPGWTMGHNVVTDGYNTDNYYHLNFGWGGGYNGWYLLPDEIPYGLTVIEGLIVNIAWAPVSTGLTNTFTDSGISLEIYPNPANKILTVSYCIDKSSHVKIAVYDMNGILVQIFIDAQKESGSYITKFDLQNSEGKISGGFYMCKLWIDEKVITKKFIVQ